MNYLTVFSDRAKAIAPSPFYRLFGLLRAKPGVISFAVGTPAMDLLPIDQIEEITKRAVATYGSQILQYGDIQGFGPLRQAVLPLLARRGIRCGAEAVHISTGGSGAMNNVAMALLNKGDTVVVERPSFSDAERAFAAYETRLVDVDCDDDGMVPAALEVALKAGGVKVVYMMPTFQNPTGRTMPAARRQAIAELLKQYEVVAFEDDVYYDLRLTGDDAPALQTYAPEQVVYMSSLSKTYAPAMRVGYAVIPPALLEKTLALKQGIDMQTSMFNQALAAEFLTSGRAERHLDMLREVYAQKLTVTVKALETHMPDGFRWRAPEGGMFLWMEGPQGFDADDLLPTAIESGVAYLPGNIFFLDSQQGRNTLRLNFASPPLDKIETGIQLLADLCRKVA